MALIKTENLTHIYSKDTPFERVAIENINFTAEKGEFIGIIGHTGSGKSTFIQHLNGLIEPTSGKVFFSGEDIHSSKEKTRDIRFKVGLVFQYPEYQLFEETVFKDIAFGPKNMKLTDDEITKRVLRAAELVGLDEELLNRSPFELSGGQKRRVAIAGVMAMEPEILVLDEPTAGLDPAGRDSIIENIMRYKEENGATVIMVTHSMEEIARFAGRLVVFSGGHIVMDGTPEEIFKRGSELEKIGLDVPQITKVVRKLADMGVPIERNIYTVEKARDAILALRGGGTIA